MWSGESFFSNEEYMAMMKGVGKNMYKQIDKHAWKIIILFMTVCGDVLGMDVLGEPGQVLSRDQCGPKKSDAYHRWVIAGQSD